MDGLGIQLSSDALLINYSVLAGIVLIFSGVVIAWVRRTRRRG